MPDACGTGLGNFPVPGDPDVTSIVLTATARDAGIDVSWTYPALLSHAVAHTLLFRSTTSSFTSAVEAAGIVVAGSHYFHVVPLVANTTYYYWIKMVSVNGTVGTLIGPASATMMPTADWIVGTLVGQIQESQLTALLRSRIDEIDNFAVDLLTEETARLAQHSIFSTLLTQQIADLAATDTLVANEVLTRTTGDTALASQISITLAVANGNTAAVLSEQQARTAADSAMALDITGVIATANGNTAAVVNEALARVNADSAMAADILALDVDYQAADGINAAAITNESSVRATADLAEAAARVALGVTFGNNIAAAITAERVVRVTAEDALAVDITNVSAAFAVADTAERVFNAAAIETERLTLANADGAMATDINTLQVDLVDESAKIQTLQTVVGDVNSGLVAEYSVRLDVNGYVSGFGLLNTGTSSEFIVVADKFAIVEPGAQGNSNVPEVPFVIGTVAGATRIVLNAASYIADATITTAKIGDAAVETLSIAGNAVTVSDAVVGATGVTDITLTMTSDATLGTGQNFVFHVNGLVPNNGVNPSTYRMLITTTLNNGSSQITNHWFYAYGPDSWTVLRAATGNSQSVKCRVQLVLHNNTSTPVNTGWVNITGHGGKR